jgi:hypothetical protein
MPEHRRAGARAGRWCAALAVTLLLGMPATAAAEEPPRTDPEVGSPAEAVYGIPLEEARRDAAPHGIPGTAIRTEQGVGSSAEVPGDSGGPAAGLDPETVAESERARRREAARAAARVSGEPSGVATAALLVLVVGIAAAGGIGASRRAGARTSP